MKKCISIFGAFLIFVTPAYAVTYSSSGFGDANANVSCDSGGWYFAGLAFDGEHEWLNNENSWEVLFDSANGRIESVPFITGNYINTAGFDDFSPTWSAYSAGTPPAGTFSVCVPPTPPSDDGDVNATSTLDSGLNGHEQLFLFAVLIFFISFGSWGKFSLIKKYDK